MTAFNNQHSHSRLSIFLEFVQSNDEVSHILEVYFDAQISVIGKLLLQIKSLLLSMLFFMVKMNFSRINMVLSVCIIICNALAFNAQEVRNVIPEIEGKKIIITYDLIGDNPESVCEVKIYFGNSASQTALLVNATGDFGSGVKPGNQKKVNISDLTPFISYQTDLTFRIEASYTYNPEFGTISVNTDPTGAKVYLDNEFVGNSNTLLTSYEVGFYKLKIEKEGFLTIEKEIEVLNVETTTLKETLTPGYFVTITSNPDKAEIKLNGTDIGTIPLDVVLKPGKNSIKISAERYYEYSTTINPIKTKSKV